MKNNKDKQTKHIQRYKVKKRATHQKKEQRIHIHPNSVYIYILATLAQPDHHRHERNKEKNAPRGEGSFLARLNV